MRFLLAANFVRDMPWTPSWWAVTLARSLSARGHEVELVLDGTEVADTALFGVPVHVARPGRIHLGAHPGRFQRLLRELRERTRATVLSLTPMVAGDLWLPLDPSPLQIAKRLIRDLKPISLALELSHHPWIGFEAWAAWRATHHPSLQLTFADSPGPTAVPRVTTLTPLAAEAAWQASRSVRDRLGIQGNDLLAVLSLPEVDEKRIGAYFRELAEAGGGSITILVATHRPHTVARLAWQAGLGGVRPITLTRSLHAVLAASDVALAPPAQSPPPRAGHGGRWIADAIALGVPVIARPDSPGAELLVESQAPCDTGETLRAALANVRSRLQARSEPPTIPPRVSLDRLLERIEDLAGRDAR